MTRSDMIRNENDEQLYLLELKPNSGDLIYSSHRIRAFALRVRHLRIVFRGVLCSCARITGIRCMVSI